MSPAFAVNDETHCALRYPEGPSDVGIQNPVSGKTADRSDTALVEDGSWVGATTLVIDGRRGGSSLGTHIPLVVRLGSQEQMGWIDAGRVVAVVENMEAVRDWPVRQLPGHPMRPPSADLIPHQQTVPAEGPGALPFPASADMDGPRPQPIRVVHKEMIPCR